MRIALTITSLDLRRRLRDRSLLIQGIVAPVALAIIVSLAFAGGAAIDFTVGVTDADDTSTSRAAAARLIAGSADGVEFVPIDSRAVAADAVDDEQLDAAVVIPAGLEEALTTGRTPEIEVLVDPARPIGGDIAEAVAQGLAGRLDAGRLAVAAVPNDPLGAAQAAAAAETPLPLIQAPVNTDYGVGSYFAPSMAILFLFLTIGTGARSLLTERKESTLTRIRSTPATSSAIVGGKTISVFVLGLASFATVYAITTLAGTNWGSPVAVIALIVATTAAVAALSTLVTGLARTDAQAEGYTSALAFGLALLGGNFVTPDAAPDLLRTLGKLTPNGWALESFTNLSAGDGTIANISGALIVLITIALAAGIAGVTLTKRQVQS